MGNALHLNRGKQPSLKMYNTSAIITSAYAVGGFCFIAGTMGFIPSYYSHCETSDMEKIGCVWYFVGSLCYTIGSFCSFAKFWVVHVNFRSKKNALALAEEVDSKGFWRMCCVCYAPPSEGSRHEALLP